MHQAVGLTPSIIEAHRAWCHILAIRTLRKWRQKEQKFTTTLYYIVSLRPVSATKDPACLKGKKERRKEESKDGRKEEGRKGKRKKEEKTKKRFDELIHTYILW